MPLIELKNIKKVFENEEVKTVAVRDVSFTIEKGEFVAIMGPSGSGKSTVMHTIGFLSRPTSGKYLFKDKDTKDLSDDEMAEARNSEIGFIFQTYNLLPRTTVFDNVKLPLIYSNISSSKQIKMANEAIEAVNLEHRKNYMSNQLSGGEQQRVAIARALVNNPDLILADEPTGNLDSKSGAQIMKILQKLNNQGKTIIMVTHESETAKHAKRVIRVRDGEIIKDEIVRDQHIMKDGAELAK